MLKNYLKTAWRNMIRNKVYTLINVFGLALGMTCCLFIFLWIQDEKSIDHLPGSKKNVYAVYQTTTANGKTDGSYSTPLRLITGQTSPTFLLENINESVPEITHQAYYATGYELPWGHPETIQFGEKKLKLDGSRAGKDFFKIFSYPLIAGNAETALKDLGGIAISRRMSDLFFSSPQEAMGKTLRYENKQNFTVNAVFEDIPEKSSFHFDFLLSWEAQKKILEWSSNDFASYVELAPGASPSVTETKINKYLETRLDKNTGVRIQIGLQDFGDKYLHSQFVNGRPTEGRIEYIKIFSGVAIFILIIACINFMNLATARSLKRAKEVGLRKVVGSDRAGLIRLFYGESLIFALVSMMISVLLLGVFLPFFNHFTDKHIILPLSQYSFWICIVLTGILTGMIAGSYPALYLSSLKPVRVLKGVISFTRGAILFRKSLTVFQFGLSILLLVSTIVITRQTSYVQHVKLGYDKENLVYTRIEGELSDQKKYLLFKEEASKMPGIAMVDRSTEAPHTMDFVVTDPINWQGKQKNDVVGFKPASVGFDFVKLMNLQIVEGRDFSSTVSTDSTDAFLVNEEAVKEMGMKDPVGKWISAWNKKGHIIGVLKDYHTQSLREPIKPVILDVKEYEYFGVIIARTQPGKTKEALASLAAVYNKINPNYPFTYQFVDEEYQKLYSNEEVISKLSVLFASLAILISCLGLLGLVMFSAEQRVKEIGVRKVLGASASQIFTLFAKDFLQLILIAFLIAAPVSWMAMHSWLADFAYRIDISWWIFFAAGIISMAIALLTTGYQAFKAAIANPVKSLRTE